MSDKKSLEKLKAKVKGAPWKDGERITQVMDFGDGRVGKVTLEFVGGEEDDAPVIRVKKRSK